MVTFSGGGATAPFPRFDSYATSKAAVVRMTENLAVELEPDHIPVKAIAPGFIVTPVHGEIAAAGPDAVGADFFAGTRRAHDAGSADSPELVCVLVAFLLSDESAGITGPLIGAQWDPWNDSAFRARLRDKRGLATLRRIDDQFFAARDPGHG